jgi:hypothetical protein
VSKLEGKKVMRTTKFADRRRTAAPYPHMWWDPHHVNFISIVLQPPTGLLNFIYQLVSPWSNPLSLQGLQRVHAIAHDKVSTRTVSPYLNESHKNHQHSKHSTKTHQNRNPLRPLNHQWTNGLISWRVILWKTV